MSIIYKSQFLTSEFGGGLPILSTTPQVVGIYRDANGDREIKRVIWTGRCDVNNSDTFLDTGIPATKVISLSGYFEYNNYTPINSTYNANYSFLSPRLTNGLIRIACKLYWAELVSKPLVLYIDYLDT